MIANLYEDLLINDRLQRSCGLDMAGVYQKIDNHSTDKLWTLYMRMYEILWKLDRGSLAHGDIDARLDTDAQLGARLIRSYAKQWLDGAGRFAVFACPICRRMTCKKCSETSRLGTTPIVRRRRPARRAHDDRRRRTARAPFIPPKTPTCPASDDAADDNAQARRRNPTKVPGGRKSQKLHRDPFEYTNIMKAMGVNLDSEQIIARYYRERAMPHLVRFPVRETPHAIDPLPEGLDVWEVGAPSEDIDWVGTLRTSPVVIPGVTTQQRLYGESPGANAQREPIDLYLGVDCSGSMSNPAISLSYPVLAGTIIALSGTAGRLQSNGRTLRRTGTDDHHRRLRPRREHDSRHADQLPGNRNHLRHPPAARHVRRLAAHQTGRPHSYHHR